MRPTTDFEFTVLDITSGSEIERIQRHFVHGASGAADRIPSPDRLEPAARFGPKSAATLKERTSTSDKRATRTVVSVSTNGGYRIVSGLRSPDHRWIGFSDDESNVLVASATGTEIRRSFELDDPRPRPKHAPEKSVLLWHQPGFKGESTTIATLRSGTFDEVNAVGAVSTYS